MTQMSRIPSSRLRQPEPRKRHQVADGLREMVRVLAPGDRLPSISELERHFSVAKSTVELAIGDLRRDGLIVRRQGSGTYVADPKEFRTHPNRVRPTTSGRTGLMAIARVGESPTGIFQYISEAIENEVRNIGLVPVLILETDVIRTMERVESLWREHRIDGFIHVGSLNSSTFPALPGVVIGEIPPSALVHQVVVDNFASGKRVAEYFIENEHRSVAFITPVNFIAGQPRRDGFFEGVAQYGGGRVAVSEATVQWPGTIAWQDGLAVEKTLKELLSVATPPTAIFVTHDMLAVSIIQTLSALGHPVPDAISVVGFDDLPLIASHHRPTLSTVRMPCAALGSFAVQTLQEAIHFPTLPPRRIRLPGELIIRESSGNTPSVH